MGLCLLQIEIILENLGGDTHTALLDNILTHMANMYKALGQPAKAITILESSLQIQENTLGILSTFYCHFDFS